MPRFGQYHVSAAFRPRIFMTRIFFQTLQWYNHLQAVQTGPTNNTQIGSTDLEVILAQHLDTWLHIAHILWCIMHRVLMRLPCAVCAGHAPRRCVASMASMVVDGQRSLEQVESELRQKLLISQDPLGVYSMLQHDGKLLVNMMNSTCQLKGFQVMGQC